MSLTIVRKVPVTGGAVLRASNNLSDLVTPATARTNLGLGTANSPTFASLGLNAATAALTLGSANTGSLAVNSSGDLTLAPKAGRTLYVPEPTLFGAAGTQGLFVINRQVYPDAADGVVVLYGGNDASSKFKLYGGSHPTFANQLVITPPGGLTVAAGSNGSNFTGTGTHAFSGAVVVNGASMYSGDSITGLTRRLVFTPSAGSWNQGVLFKGSGGTTLGGFWAAGTNDSFSSFSFGGGDMATGWIIFREAYTEFKYATATLYLGTTNTATLAVDANGALTLSPTSGQRINFGFPTACYFTYVNPHTIFSMGSGGANLNAQTAGSIGLSASGTNQDVALSPSGTGKCHLQGPTTITGAVTASSSGTHTFGTTNVVTMTAGALVCTNGFGCNSKTAQTAYASGGALNAYGAGANGFDSGANASALHAMVVAIRAALVANGIMS